VINITGRVCVAGLPGNHEPNEHPHSADNRDMEFGVSCAAVESVSAVSEPRSAPSGRGARRGESGSAHGVLRSPTHCLVSLHIKPV